MSAPTVSLALLVELQALMNIARQNAPSGMYSRFLNASCRLDVVVELALTKQEVKVQS